MKIEHVKWFAALVLSSSLVVSGCKKSTPVQNPDGTTTNANGSVTVPAGQAPTSENPPQQMAIRNPDGSITNPDGSVTYPPGSAVAQRENSPNGTAVANNNAAPVTGTAAAPPPPPPPVVRTVPVGTRITIRTTETLSASRNNVGDRFSGTLDAPVTYQGNTIFAAGTPVAGEVVAAKGKGRFKGAGDLGITLTAIGRTPVDTSEYEQVSKGRGKRTAGFIGGGGGLGAIIGGLAGGGKGALIGGLAGAGAGTAASAYTGNRDVVIPSESRVTFRLEKAISR